MKPLALAAVIAASLVSSDASARTEHKQPTCEKGTELGHHFGRLSSTYYCQLADGTKHGAFVHNGHRLRLEGEYKNGQRHGDWVTTNTSGKELGRYTMDEGTGTIKVWHANGALSYIGLMVDGKEQGTFRSYDRHGNETRVEKYKDGTPHGWTIATHSNGQRMYEQRYENGRLVGTYRSWHKSGKRSELGQYKDGAYDGIWRSWNVNGTLSQISRWDTGKRTGEQVFYNEDGTVSMIRHWKNDEAHGEWLGFSEDGSLAYRHIYEDGVNTSIETDSRGCRG